MTHILRYHHGNFRGGEREVDVMPTVTTSAFEHNNHIIEEYMAQEKKPTFSLPEELQGKKFRIRKLTPRECFRLMGVDDADIDKIQAYPYHSLIEHPAYSKAERETGMTDKEKRALMKDSISNSAQYKLAGNSIVVDVLFHLFRKMFIETGPDEGLNLNEINEEMARREGVEFFFR